MTDMDFTMTVAVADEINWSERQGRYIVRGEITWHEMSYDAYGIFMEIERERGKAAVGQCTSFATKSTGIRNLMHRVDNLRSN